MQKVSDLFYLEDLSEDEMISHMNDMNPQEQLEVFKILEKMFYRSKTNSTISILRRLIMDNNLDIADILRLQVVILLEDNMEDGVVRRVLDMIETTDVDIIIRLQVIRLIFEYYQMFHDECVNIIIKIFCDERIDVDYRYKCLLESRLYLTVKQFTHVIISCFNDNSFFIYNKVLMCQYILNHPTHIQETVNVNDVFLQFLVSVMVDEQMAQEHRLDVADILLNMRNIDPEFTEMAIQIISQFGDNRFSFYHNEENIHYVDTSTINHILEFLNHTYPFVCRQDGKSVLKRIKNMVVDTNDYSKMKVALIRIENDRSHYGAHQNTLLDILLMIFKHIENHKYSKEMSKRLVEELVEMAGTCSTGHVIRLANVLSGFDNNFSVKMLPEESLKSKLFHRLNQKITEIEEEEYRNDILYEITLPSSYPHLRMNFLKFFREVFSTLREELHEEFKDEMSGTDFDLYMRRLIVNYEGYE
jgi:hypothetical protein